ncbi:phosphohistidine phosphatase SixA [Oculatella sp. LEGE 06141]|uniref:phosphohistidine phosphatase SixA n=1 Tax=Oculatella sp. LEGE 06141 TaxID=1828648 RepID=UPI001881B17A|nr:phosphohistidine phosphatase SixA [Oculatella sp. LEGE 06141]MBE9177284.1 phosphohistidine phosphatase SixA [Oculatella sp. LEGE 06141]
MAGIELYLIRHGIAAERDTYANDGARPLTETGQHKTQRIAQRFRELELQFDLILTSPLVRARQTAEILQQTGLSPTLEQSSYLEPDGDFNGWVHWLQQWQPKNSCLALVGHEPDLGEWAERLVWGDTKQRLILKKAGIIGLLLPQTGSPVGNSQMFWLAPPRFLL